MTSPSSPVDTIEKALEGVNEARLSIRIGGSMAAYAFTETDDEGDYMTVEDALHIIIPLARQAEAMKVRVEDAEALAERLKLEAQSHAQEARTANSTINEIYQVVSGGKGEPGNWHGAAPVREKLEAMKREMAGIRKSVRNAIGAIESNQVVDKDVRGTLTRVLARLDALIGGGNAE